MHNSGLNVLSVDNTCHLKESGSIDVMRSKPYAEQQANTGRWAEAHPP